MVKYYISINNNDLLTFYLKKTKINYYILNTEHYNTLLNPFKYLTNNILSILNILNTNNIITFIYLNDKTQYNINSKISQSVNDIIKFKYLIDTRYHIKSKLVIINLNYDIYNSYKYDNSVDDILVIDLFINPKINYDCLLLKIFNSF